MKKLMLLSVLLAGCATTTGYDRPGFYTQEANGRLWVFKENSAGLEQFKKTGEPAKQYANIGAGPNGMTLKSDDPKTLEEYVKAMNSH